jgi:hypothetical protein
VLGLADDTRAILRELLTDTGAVAAEITEDADPPAEDAGDAARAVPLGGGAFLRIELPAETPRRREDLEACLERAARALRAAARRWDEALPQIAVGAGHGTRHERVVERITSFLQALAAMQHADNALVVHRGRVVASSRPLGELEEARWPFIARRAAATADKASGSSHAELADPDFFALTFWYGAALIIYFTGPYAVDFVRHRARRVARELADLLPDLDPDPASPATALRPPPKA